MRAAKASFYFKGRTSEGGDGLCYKVTYYVDGVITDTSYHGTFARALDVAIAFEDGVA